MRVITNASIIEDSQKTSNVEGEKLNLKQLFSKESQKERRTKRQERKAKRLANKKPKRNARRLFSRKERDGKESFFYPLSKLFKKDGKWFKREKDGSNSEVKTENVVQTTIPPTIQGQPSVPIAVDKSEVQKATGGFSTNWQMGLVQGLERVQEAQNQGVLPIFVPETNVTITDNGAFIDNEVQEKSEPIKDVKIEEKNALTNTQKYLVWGIGIVAVLVIGYAVYKYRSEK